jgi:hypothetical protein
MGGEMRDETERKRERQKQNGKGSLWGRLDRTKCEME